MMNLLLLKFRFKINRVIKYPSSYVAFRRLNHVYHKNAHLFLRTCPYSLIPIHTNIIEVTELSVGNHEFCNIGHESFKNDQNMSSYQLA